MARQLQFLFVVLAIFSLLSDSVLSLDIHIPLRRRNGRFARHGTANLTLLSETLDKAEHRYSSTDRSVENNGLVRRWRTKDAALDDDALLSAMENDVPWFATIQVGNPPQSLEFDLDMLSSDLYTVMTTSDAGSRYNTFLSQTHLHSEERIHPLCRNPTDVFHLDKRAPPPRLAFPICMSMKSSRHTLAASGTVLGLAPHSSLARLEGYNILQQLKKDMSILRDLWSVTLLDAENGILSLGGTIAKEMERAKIQGELELQRFGEPTTTEDWVTAEVNNRLGLSIPDLLPLEAHFRWTNIQGAAGWWTALMGGVWVNGAKVLKNQPVLLDLQCPFILAPPSAAARFYEAVGGVIRLAPPHDNFFAFPCLNQVNVAFELGGWNFPSMSGEGTRADALHGPAGGRFSLGKVGNGTGYCLGSVVETRMGLQKEWSSSGMQDTWILGEPFFRGLGVVFDNDNSRIGIRTY